MGAVLLVACAESGVLFRGERSSLLGLALFKDALSLGVPSSDRLAQMGLGVGIHLVIGVGEVGSESILEITRRRSVAKEARKRWIGEDLFPVSHAVLVASIDECLRLFGRPTVLLASVTSRGFASDGGWPARASC